MPELILKKTGQPVFVTPEGLSDALASGIYEAPAGGQKVAVELRPGVVGETDVASLPAIRAAGGDTEREESFRGRERTVRLDRTRGGAIDKVATFAENAANEATLGGFGALGEFAGGQDYTDDRLERSEANPITAGVGKVAGIIAPTLASGGTSTAARALSANPLGVVTKLGGRIAQAGKGASALTKGIRIAAGGAFEGGAQGFGQGVQQLTDTADPLTWERATSVLSSNTLMGAGIGAGANLAGKAVEKGLSKAKGYLDDAAAKLGSRSDDVAGVSEDLVGLDAKQLREARKTALADVDAEHVAKKASLSEGHAAETAALEADRVVQRSGVADEIGALRRDLKEQKLFLSTKGAKGWEGVDAAVVKEAREIGKVSLEADKGIDRMLRNPKALAARPQRVLDALQQQEAALERLAAHSDNLKTVFAADTSGERLAALGQVPAALERNRAIQQRIADLAKPVASPKLAEFADALDTLKTSPKTSPRIEAIDAAKDALMTGGAGPKGMPQKLLEGSAFGMVTSLAAPLGPLAPMLGAKISGIVGDLVFGRMGKAAAEAAKRTSAAVGAFLDVTGKVMPAAPVLATKVLSAVAYAPPKHAKKDASPAPKSTLASLYKERADEIRSQVSPGPMGPVMRRDARERVSEHLRPIAAMDPILADRMETLAARRLEFLASKLPKRPDLGVMRTGPDRWQPSDMEMRTFARYAAGVEDPGAIEERVAAGTVTPEDAEVMSAVYPERKAEHVRQIIEKLGELREQLPYARRLALSIYSGVPVDAAMSPPVLRILQASFAEEPGTEGGMQAPRAAPQFGSVKSQDATPSQTRQGA